MSKQSQKEAVYSAVTSVLSEAGINVTEGTSVASHLSRDLRAQATSILVEGFVNGTVSLDKSFSDQAELRNYSSALLSNWIRKDTRLNGGVKYQAKNPGSRAGGSDPQIKAMRLLLSTKADAHERAEIQAFIDKRQQELHKIEVKTNIDVDSLPEELRSRFFS